MPLGADLGRLGEIHGHRRRELEKLATLISGQQQTTVLHELGQLMNTLVTLIEYEHTGHLNADRTFDLDEELDDEQATEMLRAHRAKFPPGWGK